MCAAFMFASLQYDQRWAVHEQFRFFDFNQGAETLPLSLKLAWCNPMPYSALTPSVISRRRGRTRNCGSPLLHHLVCDRPPIHRQESVGEVPACCRLHAALRRPFPLHHIHAPEGPSVHIVMHFGRACMLGTLASKPPHPLWRI